MRDTNLNETNLYKKNVNIHRNLFKVYCVALIIGVSIVIIKGFI